MVYDVAYKTELLEDMKQTKLIINNINFGLSHFCKEAIINQVESELIPEIELETTELFMEDDFDPFEGVEFN